MDAEQHLKAGKLNEALAALQAQIRSRPEDASLRIFLFQLSCVLGLYEKALNQLQVLASMNAEAMLLAQIFRPVIACEMLRQEVFQGRRMPLIFGEPEPWMGLLLQANQRFAGGAYDEALSLRDRAYEEAPAVAGRVDQDKFEWLADADSRLGPMLEVIMEGKYYWIPFYRIQKITLNAPQDLRDLVWLPANFVWANGGAATAHIPSRYAGADSAVEDAIKMARKTEWREVGPGMFLGAGQRTFATDVSEYPLFACKEIEFMSASTESSP